MPHITSVTSGDKWGGQGTYSQSGSLRPTPLTSLLKAIYDQETPAAGDSDLQFHKKFKLFGDKIFMGGTPNL